ncbi:MAG: GNAT family N-acetyltransferase [Wujia sp.]
MRQIGPATFSDREAIQALYQTMLYGPADWDENYPNMDTIDFDLKRDALFAMKDETGEILAVISIDEDEEVDALTCWNEDLAPWAELARLCVRKDLHNQGIAKEMMHYVFDVLRAQGKKSVHILVKTGHVVALCAYRTLGFQTVGTCHLFDKDFVCMEIKL